jgi:hypothetical protein
VLAGLSSLAWVACAPYYGAAIIFRCLRAVTNVEAPEGCVTKRLSYLTAEFSGTILVSEQSFAAKSTRWTREFDDRADLSACSLR